MLLCDGCDRGFHLKCLKPALKAVPEGTWFCPTCSTQQGQIEGEDTQEFVYQQDFAYSANSVVTIPKSYKEASLHPKWMDAIKSEYNSLMENNTWELVDKKPGMNVLPAKWVFDLKRNRDGSIDRYKARFVCKGFKQVWGLDFDEIFAPTSTKQTLRVLLALTAKFDLECVMLDIKTAFLNGLVKEDIYVEQPEGFTSAGKVCHLIKSLYGLKQAPRVWYDCLSDYLHELGFRISLADSSLFIKGDSDPVYLLCYVDDILLIGRNKAAIQEVKELILKRFDVRDLDSPTKYLGINIDRDKDTQAIKISQPLYIAKMIEKFDMSSAKPAKSPLPVSTVYTSELGTRLMPNDHALYREIVGSIQYLAVCTRPDIQFAINLCARYVSNPYSAHMNAVKQILRYLKGTSTQGITYFGNCKNQDDLLTGYCDASFAADPDTRRSTTGYVFQICGGAVSWNSKLQPTVAISTTESEYMATSAATREAVWIRKLLSDLGVFIGPVQLFNDNQGAIKLAHNSINSPRIKHIDVIHHYIRDCINNGYIKVDYIPTEDMVADVLTKMLPPTKFLKCISSMGVN